MKYLKVLFTAGIGWWMAGPIGGIIGMIIGHLIENSSLQQTVPFASQRNGFVASLLVLMAAVMKADGKVLKSELDFVKMHLRSILGEEQSLQALMVLKEVLKKDIPLAEVCHQIRVNLDYNAKIQLLHLLYGLAKADGSLVAGEVKVIYNISRMLGISEADYQSVLNMFYQSPESAYKILEVDASVSNEELKKAYRKMAIRFHPDKVSHLGEEFQASAKEKFQKVNEAYEQLKKERGMN
ncbi:TerB family tellurite resistance protein [Geofilum rubicundum]|uniref:DnaJ-like protein DjlA n=1 Tax=Geofilum rubicundum JCM 15548 TaxID=1236989 RepID=A0A0E9LTS2_9BACT|nr:TerB family tellurite resistance protein [Geofilum rubicundum]GAO28967.1 DnaJ-like protein DjlA [Geofilum rubicundum JCM 15548]